MNTVMNNQRGDKFLVLEKIVLETLLAVTAFSVAGCATPNLSLPANPALTCDATHSCSIENLSNGFSGMARIDDKNFLIVHDYKTFGSGWHGKRLGVVTVKDSSSPKLYSYRVVANAHHIKHYLEAWPRDIKATSSTPAKPGRLASDLESACSLSGHPNQFLVAESSSYNKVGGQIFHVTLSSNLQTYEVAINPVSLPGLDPTNGQQTPDLHSHITNQSDEIYEGLACWQMLEGDKPNYLVLLGERGGTLPDPKNGNDPQIRHTTATLQWAEFSPSNKAFVWRVPINSIVAPGMHSSGDPGCWRDISGLYVDANRKIWATAAYDAEELCRKGSEPPNGKNHSVVYQLGAICLNANDPVLANRECAGHATYPAPVRLGNFTVLHKVNGFKLEAIAAPQGRGNPDLTIASEDEGGASWWNSK